MVGGSVHLSTTPKEANMKDEWGSNAWATLPTRCHECLADTMRTVNRYFCSAECAIVHELMQPVREHL